MTGTPDRPLHDSCICTALLFLNKDTEVEYGVVVFFILLNTLMLMHVDCINTPLCHRVVLAGPAEKDRGLICSILMEPKRFSQTEKMASQNVTGNHFVRHVPCNAVAVQRIHYCPAGSLLWLTLRMISLAKTRKRPRFQCGSESRRAVRRAPPAAAGRSVHRGPPSLSAVGDQR